MTNTIKEPDNERPPVMGSWKRLYLLVLLNLAVTVLIFYLLTLYLR